MNEKVSVIIPNHGRKLSRVMYYLQKSTYPNIERIVVNVGKERSIQRNIGAEKASGEYLMFLDSDMAVHENLIEECVKLSSEYDGLYIPEILPDHPIKTFIRSFYNGTRVDAIRFLKREFFIPFDEEITGFEDWDFDRRFKGKKGITTYPIYHYDEGGIRKKFYYLKWLNAYKKKYPNCPELSLRYRLFTIFVEEGKWKRLLSLPLFSNQT